MVYTCEITSFAHLRLHQRTIPPIDESGNNFLIWQWYFFSVRLCRRGGICDPSHLEREWIQAKSKSRRGGASSELWPFSFIPGSVKLTDPHPHKMTDLWPFGVIFLFLSVSCRSDRSLWWDRCSYSIITSSLLAFCCCFVCEFESLILYCFAFFNSTGNSGSFSMRGWI